MINNILQIIVGILFFVWSFWFASDDLKPELMGMAIGVGAALIIQLGVFLITERGYFKIYFDCFIQNRNKPLRLSMAYIYRIEAKGKYLLIKNNRFDIPTYQPVGGVYKYFFPEAKKDLELMSVIPCNEIENDQSSEYDLRLKMRNRKNIRKFIKWFFGNIDREIDPWREFYEELIKTKILSNKKFPFLYYDLVGQHFAPIHRDSFFKIDTLKYVDIYTPRFTNSSQKKELEKLLTIKSEDFIWVTEDEITNKISKCGKRISDHAHKIFHAKKIN